MTVAPLWTIDDADDSGVDTGAVSFPRCPECHQPMTRTGKHWACQNFECPDLKWWKVRRGVLVEIPRCVIRRA